MNTEAATTTTSNVNPQEALIPLAKDEKPLREYRRDVQHDLTEPERDRYGKRLGNLIQERDLLEEKKKQVAREYATQIAERDVEIARIADALAKGKELRSTEVFERWARSQNEIEIRTKLDGRFVDFRPASASDRQTTFPGINDGTGDDAGDGDENEAPDADDGEAELPDAEGHELEGGGKAEEADAEPPEEPGEMVDSSTGGGVYHMPDEEPEREPDGAEVDDEDDGDEGTESPVVTPPGPTRDDGFGDAPSETEQAAAPKNGSNGKADRRKAIAGAQKKREAAAKKAPKRKK